MTETVLSFFDNNWAPALWLTPSINAIGTDGTTLFTWTMSEVADGWYKYTIEKYNKYVKYLITVDWWSSMWDNRYQYVTNELDAYGNKDDRKNTGLVIDNTAIAREVRAMPTDKPRKWSYGEIVQKETEITPTDLSSILDAIKNIPEWVNMKGIREAMSQYDNKSIIDGIKEINKSIVDMTKGFEKVCEEIEEVCEDVEEVWVMLEDHKSNLLGKTELHKDEIIWSINSKNAPLESLKNMIMSFEWYLDKYTEVVEDIDMIPWLMVQYSKIIKRLWDNNNLDKKITYITLLMEDILSKLK